eukprot:76745-Chlamydomonas_euryale.AAC.1
MPLEPLTAAAWPIGSCNSWNSCSCKISDASSPSNSDRLNEATLPASWLRRPVRHLGGRALPMPAVDPRTTGAGAQARLARRLQADHVRASATV